MPDTDETREAEQPEQPESTERPEPSTDPPDQGDELAKVRHEAAGYRRKLRETEQERRQHHHHDRGTNFSQHSKAPQTIPAALIRFATSARKRSMWPRMKSATESEGSSMSGVRSMAKLMADS